MEIIIALAGVILLDAFIVIGPTAILAIAGCPRLALLSAVLMLVGLFVDQSVNFESVSYPRTGIGRILALPNDLFLLSLLFGAIALIIGLRAAFPVKTDRGASGSESPWEQWFDSEGE